MTNVAFLGVDVGTTTIKAAVYARDGRLLGLESMSTRVIRPRPSWSEQDMLEVWANVKACIAGAVAKADGAAIAAIGVCGQGDGLWAVDSDFQPVRNAVLWNDTRGDDLVLDWIDNGASARLSRWSRTSNWAGTNGTIFHWLKQNEPDAVARIAHVMFSADWIHLQLTGELATDFSDASIPFLDLETRAYPDDGFAVLGVPELKAKLSPLRRCTERPSSLRADIAAELRLPPGLPVTVGTLDLAAMMVGMDLNGAGDVGLILGTTAMVNAVIEAEPFKGEPVGATVCHPVNDRWIRVIAPLSGTSAFDWFTTLHPQILGGADVVEVAKRIADLVRPVPPGANGAMFLPFLVGERAPFVAPHATAAFHGLRASSTKAEMARAVLEGTAFSLKHCLRSTSIDTASHAFLTGGGARNALWCDILANVLGTTIVASDASDHGLWGVSMIAAAAVGKLSIDDHTPRPEKTRRHEPDPRAVETYERLYDVYEKTIMASRPIWEAQRTSKRQAEKLKRSER
jgi:erythritol kinase (D-erythritol 1-phosphate-forming)